MSATILSIFAKPERRAAIPRNWTTQEVAELYRVCEHLAQAGIRVIIDTGLSDEGEPWAVFEQCETGDVVVHIARIDGELIVSNGVSGEVYRGANFRALTDQMLDGAPLALPRFGAGSNVVMHPRVVLTAFVAATVVLAELARSTGAAEAREAQAKAQDVPSESTAVDVLTRLMSREQAQLMSSSQSGFTAVSIGLAAAAAYAAQLAAEELRASSESGGETGGWLGYLLSESRSIERSEYLSAEHLDGGTQASALAAKIVGVHDGAAAPETVQIHMFRALLDDIGEVNSVITDFELSPPAATDINAPAITLSDGAEASVSFSDTAPKPDDQSKLAGKAEPSDQARGVEYLTKVVLKVEAALVTLDLQALDTSAALASAGSSGAIVVKKPDESSGQADADVVVLGEPTAVKSLTVPAGPTYKLANEAAPTLHLSAGEDVVVYMGGRVEVFGFIFGQDRIAFIENARGPNWLADVQIVGTDVVLSGHDGGSIVLRDAATSVA